MEIFNINSEEGQKEFKNILQQEPSDPPIPDKQGVLEVFITTVRCDYLQEYFGNGKHFECSYKDFVLGIFENTMFPDSENPAEHIKGLQFLYQVSKNLDWNFFNVPYYFNTEYPNMLFSDFIKQYNGEMKQYEKDIITNTRSKAQKEIMKYHLVIKARLMEIIFNV